MTAGVDGFPWTYDQLQRYRVLEAFLEVLYPRREVTVLDVGGVSPDRSGRAAWLPVRGLVPGGRSVVLDLRPAREPGFVRGDGLHLPFRDGSFDVVASLDTLEHVPAAGRPAFLRELGRVARGTVILSAPFRDPEVERVEGLLFRQVKDRYGLEHEQLAEHRRNGLPDVGEVRKLLDGIFPAAAGFFYGSLARWLILQTVETMFLFRRNSPVILELLDRWLTAADARPELEPPFSRHYWISSNDFPAAELGPAVEAVKARLREPAAAFGEAEARELGREMEVFFGTGRVTAVVFSQGRGRRLIECLDHLLTQKVNFELEVVVWFPGPDPAKEEKLRSRFPGVRRVVSARNEPLPQGLLKVAAGAAGDRVLLLSDEVLLPIDTAQALYDAMDKAPEIRLVSPRTVFKRYLTPARHGDRNFLSRFLAGRIPRRLAADRPAAFNWVYNECLFFRKETIFDRKPAAGGRGKRSVFLWKKAAGAADGTLWTTVPHTVHKRR